MSEERNNIVENLERIENSVHELLSYDWKVDSQAEFLLNILSDSIKLKKRIRVQELANEPNDKKILQQLVADLQDQKEKIKKAQQSKDNNQQTLIQNGEKFIASIETLLYSVFDIKQLEYLIISNQEDEQVVKLLEKIRNELKHQFMTEEKNIEQAHQGHAKQQKLLLIIEKQIMEKVQLKKQQSQALQYQAQNGVVIEQGQRIEYKNALELRNQEKITNIPSLLDEYSQSQDSVKQNQSEGKKSPQTQAKPELKFQVIKQEPSYFYEKITGVTLSILTLLLLAYFIVR